jgi:hypothetical protein
MAVIADQQISLNSKSQQRHHHAKLEKASPILQESYSKTFNDRTEYVPGAPFDSNGSKQAGVLAIGKWKKRLLDSFMCKLSYLLLFSLTRKFSYSRILFIF